MQKTAPVVAYKGFDKNLQCRGYQYAVGQTYDHAGVVEVCETGFHACEYPLDIFNYYAPGAGSRFAVVRAAGQISGCDDGDTKLACASLTIEAEIGIPELVARAVEWIASKCVPEGEAATGTQGAASATGTRGAASATGTQGAASATGEASVAMACGSEGRARGAIGCALFLARRDGKGGITHAAAAVVGRGGIEADRFYVLDESGNFVKCDE